MSRIGRFSIQITMVSVLEKSLFFYRHKLKWGWWSRKIPANLHHIGTTFGARPKTTKVKVRREDESHLSISWYIICFMFLKLRLIKLILLLKFHTFEQVGWIFLFIQRKKWKRGLHELLRLLVDGENIRDGAQTNVRLSNFQKPSLTRTKYWSIILDHPLVHIFHIIYVNW